MIYKLNNIHQIYQLEYHKKNNWKLEYLVHLINLGIYKFYKNKVIYFLIDKFGNKDFLYYEILD